MLITLATVVTVRTGIVTFAVHGKPLARGTREGRVITRAGWNARGQVATSKASRNMR